MPRDINDRFPERQLKPDQRTRNFLARRSGAIPTDRRTSPGGGLVAGGGGGASGGGAMPATPGLTQSVTSLPLDVSRAAPGTIYNVPGGEGEASRLVTVIRNADGTHEYRDVIQGASAWPAAHNANFGTSGTGNGQFAVAIRDIAVDSAGNLYVTSDNRIQKFSANGTYIITIATFGTGNGQVSAPAGLSFAPNGYLYVADLGNNRIQWFIADVYAGQFGSFGAGNGQFNSPVDVSAGVNNLFVADLGNDRIVRCTLPGPVFAANITGFDDPTAVLLDVQRSGPSSLNYVWATNAGVTNTVQLFWGAQVITVGQSGSSKGQFNAPHSIALDTDGNIHVTDSGNHRVQVFDRNGIFQGSYGSFGTGDGQFDTPTGIAITDDYIYVCDSGNFRVCIFVNPAARSSLVLVGRASVTWDPPNLTAGAGAQLSPHLTVSGALTTDLVRIKHTGEPSVTATLFMGTVISTDTVRVVLRNVHSVSDQDVPSGTVTAYVERWI